MLKAKLQAPAVNQTIISREKLQSKFRRVREGNLTLVTAPAGSGKTTAVLEWLGQCGLPWTWLPLDAGMAGKILEQLTAQEKKVLELLVNASTNQ